MAIVIIGLIGTLLAGLIWLGLRQLRGLDPKDYDLF